MADLTDHEVWKVLRIIRAPIADDPDWADTQDTAAVLATDPKIFSDERLGIVSVRIEWYDASNVLVAGRGSFNLQPTELNQQVNPLDGTPGVRVVTDTPATGAVGYRRYDLANTSRAQGFTVRLSSIVVPATVTQIVVKFQIN